MENFEIFNLYAGRVFSRLYASFPMGHAIVNAETVNPPDRQEIHIATEVMAAIRA